MSSCLPLPPFARELPERYPEVWIYIGGADSDLAWRLAKWRSRAKLPALLVPSETIPASYAWPPLRGAEALLVYLPGAPLETAPTLALALFEANAAVVRVLDTEQGRMTVYRRTERAAA